MFKGLFGGKKSEAQRGEDTVWISHAARQQGTRVAISFDAGQEWQSSCFETLRYLEKPDGLVKIRALQ